MNVSAHLHFFPPKSTHATIFPTMWNPAPHAEAGVHGLADCQGSDERFWAPCRAGICCSAAA